MALYIVACQQSGVFPPMTDYDYMIKSETMVKI